jgi:hypothetical protein
LLNRYISLCTLTVVVVLLFTLAFLFDVTFRALAVIERLVAAADKFAIRIDRTGKAAWNRWLDWWRNIWLDWCRNRRRVIRDTFVFVERFVVSMVTRAIMKAVVAPFVRDAVRVDGTLVVTVTPEEKSRFLKRGDRRGNRELAFVWRCRSTVAEKLTGVAGAATGATSSAAEATDSIKATQMKMMDLMRDIFVLSLMMIASLGMFWCCYKKYFMRQCNEKSIQNVAFNPFSSRAVVCMRLYLVLFCP